ncbi:LRR and PYD domains-containing 12-like protein [Labeo rohita]|uniref:LRR and PYD domains-containing 12-like protein n=1 Tax=Labeo rohita TaxID=84645 RepID=A0A498NH20_LABRO|nr:LRR and PYD domains-containing 12-like protein [Labeo rohita]
MPIHRNRPPPPKLSLENCRVTEAGCVYLSKALRLNPSHLRVLDLSWNNIGDSGVKYLCTSLMNIQCALETLSLEEKSYSSGPSVLSMKSDRSMQIPIQLKNGSVPMEKSLEEKSDSSGPSILSMKSDRSKQIPIQLKNGSAPMVKSLKNCGVTEAGCDFLSSALSLNPSHLKVLDLSWNDIGDSGVKHLCAALVKTQCALETLKLYNCNVTHEGVTALTKALKSNPSHLKEFDLLENDLEESDLNVLSMILDTSSHKLKK